MTRNIVRAALPVLLLAPAGVVVVSAASAPQPAARAEEAVRESGLKSWWNRWLGVSKEKAVQVLENREEIAAKARDKGEKIRSTAEKMAEQAQKQRGKGNDNAAAALQQNAARLGGIGETIKDTGEKVRDKGGDVLKQLNKRLGKK